jgi:hypothetical protein
MVLANPTHTQEGHGKQEHPHSHTLERKKPSVQRLTLMSFITCRRPFQSRQGDGGQGVACARGQDGAGAAARASGGAKLQSAVQAMKALYQ